MINMKEITVSISKKLSKNYNSDGVMASITMTMDDRSEVADAYKEAWAICQEEVDKQANEVKTTNQIEESVNKSSEFTSEMAEELVPHCPIHNMDMVLRPAGISKTTGKGYPAFYACPGKDVNGKFCSYRPPKVI